jgi:hypothetical protein
MKTMLCLTEFVLKAMILGVCPTKRSSRDEGLEEASEQLQRSLLKNLIRLLPVQDH